MKKKVLINYANERLQQQFYSHMFKLEQTEYQDEDIKWEHIGFVDNQATLDVFDRVPSGLFAVLDDACRVPKGSDDSIM